MEVIVANKILVPLDGSKLAESSLVRLRTIVGPSTVSEIVLLRVVEQVYSYEIDALSQARHHVDDVEQRGKADAEVYLSSIAKNLGKEGISVKTAVVFGKAAESILDYAEQNNVDLIVISTHGRSGISRWAFGSVADKVAHYSKIPVLLVTGTEGKAGEKA
jgi:nucleotide-binding universal stress UspA family protein